MIYRLPFIFLRRASLVEVAAKFRKLAEYRAFVGGSQTAA